MPRALRPRRQPSSPPRRARARAHRVPPSVLRSRVAGLPRRVRHARAGHGHRAQLARVRRRRLPVVPPLRHDGRRDPESGAGRRPLRREPAVLRRPAIWDANPQIVEKLREDGALFHAEKFTHSYMHCWRHKTPIIYRATTQWFAGMDDVPGYRGASRRRRCARRALRGIERPRSFPRGARRGCTA